MNCKICWVLNWELPAVAAVKQFQAKEGFITCLIMYSNQKWAHELNGQCILPGHLQAKYLRAFRHWFQYKFTDWIPLEVCVFIEPKFTSTATDYKKFTSLKGCTLNQNLANPEKYIRLESNEEFQKQSNVEREENHSWLTTYKTDEIEV